MSFNVNVSKNIKNPNNLIVLNQTHTRLTTAQNIYIESNSIYVDAENHYGDSDRLQHICIGQYERPIHAQIAFAELIRELSNGNIAIAMSKEDAKKQAKKAGVSSDDTDFVVNIIRGKTAHQILDDPDDYDEDDEDDDFDDYD